MATATKICITPEHGGVFHAGLSSASALKVSEVLQHDMENHHIYLNYIEFHNHIAHFMLTIYALGASPETIQEQYSRENTRQRPALPQNSDVIKSLSTKQEFMKYLYQEAHYPNYLAFFQREIDTRGIPAVLNEYLFSGDDRAESLLSRMFAGLVHPIIHLGFGVEFQQPAIVAQALAQACVHEDYLGECFFVPAENAARGRGQRGCDRTLGQIMDQMRADPRVSASTNYKDTDRFKDGLLKRAGEEVIGYCSQWTVPEDKIQDKLVEMINTAIYWTATAQNPPKQLKLDFFYIHAVNLSIFFHTFMNLPYLSSPHKARLLEMKGRMDLLIWASRNMPEPQLSDVMNYPIHRDWPEVFVKSCAHPSDDGHLAKFVRTVAHAEKLCRPYEAEAEERGLRVVGDMWLKIANIAVNSVGVVFSDLWVRGAGFAECWEKFGPRN